MRRSKVQNKLDKNKGKASDNLAESLIAGNFVLSKASVKFISKLDHSKLCES